MEHICKNCNHYESFGIVKSGNCKKLTQLKQDSGEVEKNKETVIQGRIFITEQGISVGYEYGKDCEYFSEKK